jgi:hypothetical protein
MLLFVVVGSGCGEHSTGRLSKPCILLYIARQYFQQEARHLSMATKKTKAANVSRCPWPGDDPLYQAYHDKEWGVPVRSDKKLFEFLILEGCQAGLSWITILPRRL